MLWMLWSLRARRLAPPNQEDKKMRHYRTFNCSRCSTVLQTRREGEPEHNHTRMGHVGTVYGYTVELSLFEPTMCNGAWMYQSHSPALRPTKG